jgi:electron transport complex protein RnfD
MSAVATFQLHPIGTAAPHRVSGDTHRDIVRSWILAASVVGLAGVAIFGLSALKILVVAIICSMGTEVLISMAFRKSLPEGLLHSVLTGLLLGLTLPANVPAHVAAFGGIVSILAGKSLFGGLGHYTWHPAMVGRVVIQLVFSQQLTLMNPPREWPVLAPGHLLVGDLGNTSPVSTATYSGWLDAPGKSPTDAWSMQRPVQALRLFADGKIPADGENVFDPLLRDALPPWQDTLFGVVPGGIGETCTIAIIVAGLYLIYRGYLRWQMPAAVLAAAFIAAALFPVKAAGSESYIWMPLVHVEEGRAVGAAYMMFHLTAGELMLGAFLLAGDMMCTPLRARGQLLFGAGVGLLTIFMRLYGVIEGEMYWSILIMNTLVTLIDSRTRRPVLGIPEA